MGNTGSHHHYHVDEKATQAARKAEAAANKARDSYLQKQRELLQRQALEAERRVQEAQAQAQAQAKALAEAERARFKAQQEAEARHKREIESERSRRESERVAAAATLEEKRLAAEAAAREAEKRRVAEQEVAAAALEEKCLAAEASAREAENERARRLAEQEAAAAALEASREEAERRAEAAREDAIKQERIRVHEERLREWQELNRDYPIPEHLEPFISRVLDDVDEDAACDRFINVGVLGYSGVGKSSLISQILKYLGAAEGVMPLSSFEADGTVEPTAYVVDGFNDKVRIWDLPGQGTEKFPSVSYLRDMGLKYFDAVLVVTDGRWKTNDSTLLDAIRFAGIWFKVVRTKIDQAVEAGEYDHGMSQEEALEEARAKLAQQLINVADPTMIHLVTTRERFWIGGHGGSPYGLVKTLCDEVAKYIEDRADQIYGRIELPADTVRDDLEVNRSLNFEQQVAEHVHGAEEHTTVSSVSSTITVRS